MVSSRHTAAASHHLRTWPLLVVAVLCVAAAAAQAAQVDEGSNAPAVAAANPPFDLLELRVLGNSVLTAIDVERLLTPFLGPRRSLDDVEAARVALEGAYHAQGYGTVFVDIPEQSIGDDGVVRLRVTESRLRRANISGTRYFSNRQIRNALPGASRDAVPNLPALQAQITAVNAVTADRSVVPVLKAGPVPGTVDLELKVTDELPLHVMLEVNDQYTADTSRLRSSIAVSYDNAFGRQDSATLQYQASPQDLDEVSVFAASYVARLGESVGGMNKLSVTFIDSSSNVATLGDIAVAGKGRTYSARLIHSFAASQAMQAGFAIGADFKDSAQDVRLSAADSLSTPLSYASLQASYNLALREPTRLWTSVTSVAVGLPSLGSSRQEFSDKCYRCRPNFSVLRTEAGLRQKLPWGLDIALQFAGQYAVDPLISNEQILIGGAHSVRGYLEAEELGDIGVRGSLELRATALFGGVPRFHAEPYVFFDAGVVRFQAPLPGQPASTALRSAGLGLDVAALDFLTLSLTLAEPLRDASRTRSGDERLGFLIRTAW